MKSPVSLVPFFAITFLRIPSVTLKPFTPLYSTNKGASIPFASPMNGKEFSINGILYALITIAFCLLVSEVFPKTTMRSPTWGAAEFVLQSDLDNRTP